MINDESVDEKTIASIAAYLEKMEQAVDSVLRILIDQTPNWVPAPAIDRTKRTIQKLINDGFSENEILQRVLEAERDGLTFPGIVPDPTAFSQSIYELAHLKHAISLGESMGLRALAGDQAELGQRFKNGRKPGSGGPIRKAIMKILAKSPEIKNPEIWEAIKKNPPKFWQAYENAKLGKYFEGPTAKEKMEYKRFCTVCGEERKKLMKKIPG